MNKVLFVESQKPFNLKGNFIYTGLLKYWSAHSDFIRIIEMGNVEYMEDWGLGE